MTTRTWKALSAVFAAIAIMIAALTVPNIADAGVTGSVGNGPMVFQSGTYTPTASSTANVSSYTAQPSHYTRVGDVVTVYGIIYVQVTSNTGTGTSLDINLPIASTFSSIYDLSIVGTADAQPGNTVWGFGVLTTNKAHVFWYSTASDTTNQFGVSYSFSYIVK